MPLISIIPEFRDYLRNAFETIINDEWGYRLLKLDFLYAACIVPVSTRLVDR